MIYKTINVLHKIQAVPSSRVTVSRDTALHNQLNVIQHTVVIFCIYWKMSLGSITKCLYYMTNHVRSKIYRCQRVIRKNKKLFRSKTALKFIL